MLVTIVRVIAWGTLALGLLAALLSWLIVEPAHAGLAVACWSGAGIFAWLCLLVLADGMAKARKLKEWGVTLPPK